MAVEHQSFKEVSNVESSMTRPSGAQTEALNLLQNSGLTERRVVGTNIPSQLNTDNLYNNSVFSVGSGNNSKLFDSQIGTCSINKPKCESEKNWRPDAERTTPGARTWDKQAESQRQKPLERNADGSYTVRPGDSLNDIARRMLKGEGSKNPSQKDVAEASKRIYEANPKLGCNPDLIRPGMELKVPGGQKNTSKPPQGERPQQRVERQQQNGDRHPSLNNGEPRRGFRNRPQETFTDRRPDDNQRNDVTNERTKRSGKSTEQQLDEMKKVLESMKKTLEEMQAKQQKQASPEQSGRRTEQPSSKPPTRNEQPEGRKQFFAPEAQKSVTRDEDVAVPKLFERMNSAEPRIEELKPSNPVENAEPRKGWRPRNNGIGTKPAVSDLTDPLKSTFLGAP